MCVCVCVCVCVGACVCVRASCVCRGVLARTIGRPSSLVHRLVYWGLTPQQQPGSYRGGEVAETGTPEETTDLRQPISQKLDGETVLLPPTFVCVCVCLYLCLFLSISVCLSIPLYLCLSVCVCLFLSISLSVCLSV